VGTTRTDKDTVVDLIGDDASAPSASATVSSGPSTQDLLADIFGSSSMESMPATSTPAQPAHNANADIMSLFSNTPSAQSPPPAQPSSGSLLDMVTPSAASTSAPPPQPQQQTPAPAPAAAKSQLQSYTAYEKNGLKITLTPRVSPTQPGVVQILARFMASEAVQGINLQVAVPKVRLIGSHCIRLTIRLSNCRCRQCPMRTSRRARLKRNK
jgi:AP-1 complex subunit gamma-1